MMTFESLKGKINALEIERIYRGLTYTVLCSLILLI